MKRAALEAMPLEGARGPYAGTAYQDTSDRWHTEGRRKLLGVYGSRPKDRGSVYIANYLGVPHQTVSDVLAGKSIPRIPLAAMFKRAWGIPIESWDEAPRLEHFAGKPAGALAAPESPSTCEPPPAAD